MSNQVNRKYLRIVLVLILVLVLSAVFWVKSNIYASPFDRTFLTPIEQAALNDKISKIRSAVDKEDIEKESIVYTQKRLDPEPYKENDSLREIELTEKELNSLITNPAFARRVAVDLSDDLLSVKMLIPLEPDFPVLGGKTIKLNFGTTLAFKNNNLVVAMKGISLGGIPIPSAWWGDIKNENLVEYFSGEDGFWDILAAGISDVRIYENGLYVRLKE